MIADRITRPADHLARAIEASGKTVRGIWQATQVLRYAVGPEGSQVGVIVQPFVKVRRIAHHLAGVIDPIGRAILRVAGERIQVGHDTVLPDPAAKPRWVVTPPADHLAGIIDVMRNAVPGTKCTEVGHVAA